MIWGYEMRVFSPEFTSDLTKHEMRHMSPPEFMRRAFQYGTSSKVCICNPKDRAQIEENLASLIPEGFVLSYVERQKVHPGSAFFVDTEQWNAWQT